MTGRTHQFIGFTTVYTFALLASYDSFNLQTVVFGVVLISLGALMPDLDSEDNVIYSLVPVGRRVISEIFERVFGRHRSISHSLLGIFLFGLLSHWLIFRNFVSVCSLILLDFVQVRNILALHML